jgi:DNA-binding NarL/FixJ family response regulator
VPPILVLLAEDHAIVREGTREILKRDASIEVVGEAGDGVAAVAMAAELTPHVVLMDVAMPLLNGIEATRRMRAAPNPPRVLMLSAYDDQDYVRASIAAGANGYVLKIARASDIVAAIHAVAGGAFVLHPAAVARTFLREGQDALGRDSLSSREIEIIRHAAQGARTHEIATQLRVSSRTVEAQLTTIFNKLGVSTRREAVAYAIAHDWLAFQRAPQLDLP